MSKTALSETEVDLVRALLETLEGVAHPLSTQQLERAVGKTFGSKPLGAAWQAATSLGLIRYAGTQKFDRSERTTFDITQTGRHALDQLRRKNP